jgi:hypothetical protein
MVLVPERAGEHTSDRFSGVRKFLTSQSRLSMDVVLLRYQIVPELLVLSNPEEASRQQHLPALACPGAIASDGPSRLMASISGKARAQVTSRLVYACFIPHLRYCHCSELRR